MTQKNRSLLIIVTLVAGVGLSTQTTEAMSTLNAEKSLFFQAKLFTAMTLGLGAVLSTQEVGEHVSSIIKHSYEQLSKTGSAIVANTLKSFFISLSCYSFGKLIFCDNELWRAVWLAVGAYACANVIHSHKTPQAPRPAAPPAAPAPQGNGRFFFFV